MLPVSLTGDFSREYNFSFSLYSNPGLSKANFSSFWVGVKAIFKTITTNANLAYVSQMAMKVTYPPSTLETDTISIGTIDIHVPQKFKVEPFTITYIDDELDTVYNFHKGWQSCVRKGWSFELLSLASLSCVMSTTVRTPNLGLDVPTTVTNFPQIFPTQIQMSDFDRNGNSLREVNVTYIRIPKIVDMSGVQKKIQTAQDKIMTYLKF